MGLLECLEECVVAVWASVFTCLRLLDCVSYQYMCGGVNIGHWDIDVEIQLGGETIINNRNNNNNIPILITGLCVLFAFLRAGMCLRFPLCLAYTPAWVE